MATGGFSSSFWDDDDHHRQQDTADKADNNDLGFSPLQDWRLP
jgi:hypothetical protein